MLTMAGPCMWKAGMLLMAEALTLTMLGAHVVSDDGAMGMLITAGRRMFTRPVPPTVTSGAPGSGSQRWSRGGGLSVIGMAPLLTFVSIVPASSSSVRRPTAGAVAGEKWRR